MRTPTNPIAAWCSTSMRRSNGPCAKPARSGCRCSKDGSPRPTILTNGRCSRRGPPPAPLLGIFQSDEARRAASRERVRQHRERKQQGIVLRPRKEPPSVTAEQILDELKQQLAFQREIEAKRSPDGQ